MSNWYMEIIDCRHRGSKTGMGATGETDGIRAAFEDARRLVVPIKSAEFLVDLHDSSGDLIDTIPINANGFETLMGAAPRSADYYDQYDTAYWSEVRGRRS